MDSHKCLKINLWRIGIWGAEKIPGNGKIGELGIEKDRKLEIRE